VVASGPNCQLLDRTGTWNEWFGHSDLSLPENKAFKMVF